MAPSYPSSKGKGKSRDQSTPWSDWILDNDHNCYYQWRINANGDQERYYDSPGVYQPDNTVPRTPGPDAQEPYYSIKSSSNSVTSDYNYTTSYQEPYSPDPSQSVQHTGFPATDDSYDRDEFTTGTAINSGDVSESSGSRLAPGSNLNYSMATDSQNTPTYDNGSSSQSWQRPATNSLGTITQGIEAMSFGEQKTSDTQIPTPKRIYTNEKKTKIEKLSDKYQSVEEKDQKKFWRQGRVFMMLWTEPAAKSKVPAEGGTRDGSHISTTWLNQEAYSEIRRFVVVRQGYGNNICCPIQTYSGQATLKPGLPDPQQHAIIYTSDYPPPPHSMTFNGEEYTEQLTKLPIKVTRVCQGPEGDLGTLSRLNYSKLYTVENYVRVLNIGMVHKDSLPVLDANSLVKTTREEPVGKPREDTRKKSSGGNHRNSHHKKK